SPSGLPARPEAGLKACATSAADSKLLELQQVAAEDHLALEVLAREPDPRPLGIDVVVWNEVRQDECLDAGLLRDAAHVLDGRMALENVACARPRVAGLGGIRVREHH